MKILLIHVKDLTSFANLQTIKSVECQTYIETYLIYSKMINVGKLHLWTRLSAITCDKYEH